MLEMAPDEDAQVTAEIADPSLIVTFSRCMEIIGMLDIEISGIERQLEVARAEAAVMALSSERQGWLRRAAGALSFKKSERLRVWKRGRELRGVKGPAQTPPRQDRAEAIAKQERLKVEAEARKAGKQALAAASQAHAHELVAAANWRKHFVAVANERMNQEEFQQWVAEAKRRAKPSDI